MRGVPEGSDGFRKLNRAQLRSLIDQTPADLGFASADPAAESVLQTGGEQWLTQRGYRRMTAENAEGPGEARGWFGHLHEPRGNPLMSDLFIFDAAGRRCLLIEFKRRAVFQPGQAAMIRRGVWWLAWDLDGFQRLVLAWEERGETADGTDGTDGGSRG